MTVRLTVALLTMIILAGAAFSQATTQAKQVKTVRIHIDGFMKSKSGAV
ncbi:MAG: hypothetical protein ACREBD_05360 [Blastocatellia bacterium]